MKNIQKARKMKKGKRISIEILKIISASFKISVGVTSMLLILNSIMGGFIGFSYYVMLIIAMTATLVPCWLLCDSNRIFNNKVYKSIKINNTNKKARRNNSTIRRKKIS